MSAGDKKANANSEQNNPLNNFLTLWQINHFYHVRWLSLMNWWYYVDLSFLHLLFPVSQARWCDAEAHPWWDCSLALLPLARGDFPGWSPHRGPDHLCQELGYQGRGNNKEEAFVSGKAACGKRNLQEGLMWGSLTHLQVGGAPSCISFQGLICSGATLVSGLFLGDCPVKCLLIASSTMALNK